MSLFWVFLDLEIPALLGCLTNFIYLKVQGHIKKLIEENFRDELEQAMRDPILFGDFRMALSEGEPRIYEDIQDYDAAKALFQVVCFSLELCMILSLCMQSVLEPASNSKNFVLLCARCNSEHRRTTSHPLLWSGVMKIEYHLWSWLCFPTVYFPWWSFEAVMLQNRLLFY